MIVGTRAVQQSILDSYPDEDIQVILIWIRMYEVDTIEASQLAANQFCTDTRVIHFYDPGQLLGRTIAERFGAEAGKVAWDIYLFYDGDEKWGERVPLPLDWAHQLLESSWADPARLHRGDKLVKKLQEIMEGIRRGGRAV
jgi:hypothetical protein